MVRVAKLEHLIEKMHEEKQEMRKYTRTLSEALFLLTLAKYPYPHM
mgnify:CR=1 FL=1